MFLMVLGRLRAGHDAARAPARRSSLLSNQLAAMRRSTSVERACESGPDLAVAVRRPDLHAAGRHRARRDGRCSCSDRVRERCRAGARARCVAARRARDAPRARCSPAAACSACSSSRTWCSPFLARLLGLALVWFALPLLFSSTVATAAPGHCSSTSSVDRYVVAFAVLAACASALAFGFVPAWRGARVDLLAVINDELSPRAGATERASRGARRRAGGGLRALADRVGLWSHEASTRLEQADTGFDATTSSRSPLDLKPNGYDESRGRAFFDDLLDDVRTSRGSSRRRWPRCTR